MNRDPYPIFERLRVAEPVSWIDELQMWYLTRYRDIQAVLGDPVRFTTRFESSTIFDTFGTHMLTSDGAEQQRYHEPWSCPRHLERRTMHVSELSDEELSGLAGVEIPAEAARYDHELT